MISGSVSRSSHSGWQESAERIGYVSNDGRIDDLDARLWLQPAEGATAGTAFQLAAADVDEDGDVDRTDTEILAEYVIGMRLTLP